jgi:hypothetical protein
VAAVAVAALASGCGGGAGGRQSGGPSAPAAASPSASPSPTVDVAASTRAVCAELGRAVFDAAATELGRQLGLYVAHRDAGNRPEQDKARAAVQTALGSIAAVLRTQSQVAADEQLRTELTGAAAEFERVAADPAFLAALTGVADVQAAVRRLFDPLAAVDRRCG